MSCPMQNVRPAYENNSCQMQQISERYQSANCRGSARQEDRTRDYTQNNLHDPGDIRQSAQGKATNEDQRELNAVNKVRAQNGLPPLIWQQDLADAAQTHNRNMAVRGWDHYDTVPGARQNIAMGNMTPEQVVDEYISERNNVSVQYPTGHRDAILNPNARYFGSSNEGDFNTQNII